MILNQIEAQNRINELGSLRQPFFFLIDFEKIKCQVHTLEELPENINFDFNQRHATKLNEKIKNTKKIIFDKYPISYERYNIMFDQAIKELLYGNTFLVNLTCKTPISCNLSLSEIYHRSSAKYKLLIKDHCVAFSPESFIQIINNRITSYPMKGTIDASIKYAEYKLINNEKEKQEHNTIVDLIRNDISIYATNVQVPKFRYIDRIATKDRDLLQASSKIEGNLTPDFHQNLGDIIFSMLPAGSISGAPKDKTVKVIKNIENTPRGYYTGIMGIYDGTDLDSGVLIRYIEQDLGKLYYRSGGGITHQSQAEQEYKEMIDKIYLPFK